MATLTFEDKERNLLIKKFHTLLVRAGVGNDGKEAMLWSYGVESTRDLEITQLIELCGILDAQINPKHAELDKLRKRVMAAIGGWLKNSGRDGNNAEYIKAIACQATGYNYFNRIPAERLRNLYYNFCNKQKDKAASDEIIMINPCLN